MGEKFKFESVKKVELKILFDRAFSQLSENQKIFLVAPLVCKEFHLYTFTISPHIIDPAHSQHNDPSLIEYQGFVRVHMCLQRLIHVSTAVTRASWYRYMRPVKERTTNSVDGMSDGFEVRYIL